MRKRLILLYITLVSVSFPAFSQEFKVIFDEEPVSAKSETSRNSESVSGKDTIRNLIIDKAKQYLGVSYKYGQSAEGGFDCSGYVKFVYGQFGYSLPHSSFEQYSASKRLKQQKALPGDLVFFTIQGQRISHVGIYIGDNSFIHSPSRGKQVCIDSLDAAYYKKHFAGFGSVL